MRGNQVTCGGATFAIFRRVARLARNESAAIMLKMAFGSAAGDVVQFVRCFLEMHRMVHLKRATSCPRWCIENKLLLVFVA